MLRVLRLARVFRLLKVSKDSVALLCDTMWRSARPLNILGFLLAISIVMFSAVLYYTERGRFDEHQGRWIRTVGFDCEIACGPETNKLAHAFLACDDASADSTETQTMFFARHKFTTPGIDESDACVRVEEHSPFQSILHAVWWAVVTMSTVGYGDKTIKCGLGRLMAVVRGRKRHRQCIYTCVLCVRESDEAQMRESCVLARGRPFPPPRLFPSSFPPQ